jgi:putative transposase
MINDINNYFKLHKVVHAVREYIQDVRTNEPSRLVGRQAGSNVCTRYASKKMGRAIQTESRTAELPYAIEFEYDKSVIEYWDQPEPITIYLTYKNGIIRGGSYTADFLVLTDKGPLIVEVKTAENLVLLLEKNPDDWVETSEGITYRPAKEAFEKLGIAYKVYSTANINLVRIENIKLLLSSRTVEKSWDENFKKSVFKILSDNSWIKLCDLAKELGIVDLTSVIQMVDEGLLHISLNNELLSQPESTWISSSSDLANIGFESRNYNEYLFDEGNITINKIPTEMQAIQALKNLERIKAGKSDRSVRRWKEKVIKGKILGLSPFQSLLPKYHLSGNRAPRLNKKCIDFIIKFIKEYYSTTLRLMPLMSYNYYCELAKKEHPNYKPVSRKTLRQYILKSNQLKIARGRGGKRAANAAANPSDVDTRGFIATAPFELASLDHYLVDQECEIVTSDGKTYTAKPWLTAMIDIYSKIVLAVWLTFRAPSKRSCAMVIRMCAKKHGRLPKSVIVDQGADFRSVFFDSLLSHFDMDNTQRPAGHSRFGAEIERFFGLYKTDWLALRPGNTAIHMEGRSVSGSHTAKKTASLSIEDTWDELNQYIEWRNNVIVGNEKVSPVDKLNLALEQYPFVGVDVEYNNEFKILSAVDTKPYTVDPVRGINIDGIHYWAPELTSQTGKRKTVNVRFEPENPYQIYAQLNDKWVICRSSETKTFITKDPVIRLAEASRTLDCRAIRDQAKQDASQSLVRKIMDVDESYKFKTNISSNEDVREFVNLDDGKVISLFDSLMDEPLEDIEESKWGN